MGKFSYLGHLQSLTVMAYHSHLETLKVQYSWLEVDHCIKKQCLASAQFILFYLMCFLLFCDQFFQLDPHLTVSHQDLSLITFNNQKYSTT